MVDTFEYSGVNASVATQFPAAHAIHFVDDGAGVVVAGRPNTDVNASGGHSALLLNLSTPYDVRTAESGSLMAGTYNEQTGFPRDIHAYLVREEVDSDSGPRAVTNVHLFTLFSDGKFLKEVYFYQSIKSAYMVTTFSVFDVKSIDKDINTVRSFTFNSTGSKIFYGVERKDSTKAIITCNLSTPYDPDTVLGTPSYVEMTRFGAYIPLTLNFFNNGRGLLIGQYHEAYAVSLRSPYNVASQYGTDHRIRYPTGHSFPDDLTYPEEADRAYLLKDQTVYVYPYTGSVSATVNNLNSSPASMRIRSVRVAVNARKHVSSAGIIRGRVRSPQARVHARVYPNTNRLRARFRPQSAVLVDSRVVLNGVRLRARTGNEQVRTHARFMVQGNQIASTWRSPTTSTHYIAYIGGSFLGRQMSLGQVQSNNDAKVDLVGARTLAQVTAPEATGVIRTQTGAVSAQFAHATVATHEFVPVVPESLVLNTDTYNYRLFARAHASFSVTGYRLLSVLDDVETESYYSDEVPGERVPTQLGNVDTVLDATAVLPSLRSAATVRPVQTRVHAPGVLVDSFSVSSHSGTLAFTLDAKANIAGISTVVARASVDMDMYVPVNAYGFVAYSQSDRMASFVHTKKLLDGIDVAAQAGTILVWEKHIHASPLPWAVVRVD